MKPEIRPFRLSELNPAPYNPRTISDEGLQGLQNSISQFNCVICYEPFSGSGSQIIAAEKLNRRCFAMEIEPVFVDVAVKRWEAWTGKKGELIRGNVQE